ncbi:TPA: hypothetical protein ENG04_04125 [Candidatus Poribacteria bacterium]|nr:hypothetical protein [Candidatus Poribacteria bacterium]HEX29248.1 hypothetical protein [Candidatus Poribacteria bacterium]
MKRIKSIVLIISIVIATLSLDGISLSASPDAFSHIGSGARVCALGGAFVGAADDVSASYWNPAGLTQLTSPAFSVTDRVISLETNYITLSGALPLRRWGVFGVNLIFHGVGKIQGYDTSGNPTETGFSKEGALFLSYAYEIANLSLSMGIKGVYQSIGFGGDNTQSWGTGLTLSALCFVTDALRVGVVVRDKMKVKDMDDESAYSVETPLSITSGMLYSAQIAGKHRFNVMIDLEQRRELPLKAHLGAEISLYDGILSLRGGLDDLYLEDRGENVSLSDLIKSNLKPTFGLGMARSFKTGTLKLDYAASFEKLGTRSFVSIGWRF